MAISIAGCSKSKKWDKDQLEKGIDSTEITNDIVTAKLIETDFSKDTKSITIKFDNTTGNEMYYGKEPNLEVLIDEEWYKVPFKLDVGWDDIGLILEEEATYTENLSTYYNDLFDGRYRYYKSFYLDGVEVIAGVEFDME
jgi:hypothetical protein